MCKKFAHGSLGALLALSVCLPGQLAFADEPDAADELNVVGSSITDEEIQENLKGLEEPTSDVSSADSSDMLRSLATPDAPRAADARNGASVARSGSDSVITLAGETQYDTSAAEAQYAFSSSRYAIVASGESAVDALSASALAGALECPILLTASEYLPESVQEALMALGVQEVVVVGGAAVVSEDVATAIANVVGSAPVRLAGYDLFDTQLEIYNFGKTEGLWGKTAFVANGILSYADALSASPLAYSMKAPVFLADENGTLPEKTVRALTSGGFTRAVAVGGTAVISERTMGVLDATVIASGGSYSDVVRIAGESLYDTSAAVARWAVQEGLLSWDGAAFATGRFPYDALAGGAVQGKEKSVLLLVDEGQYAALDAVVDAGEVVSSIKFLGGRAVVTPVTRLRITAALGLSSVTVGYEDYAITLDRLADIEYTNTIKYHSCSRSEVLSKLGPANFSYGESGFYQFADLSQGYSGTSAAELDAFIASHVGYSERSYGVTSKMRGTGAYFIEAAKTYNVNEVYLVAHAALESAWGCSRLSQGKVSGYEGYLNFYGIGAYDADPYNGGAAMAKQQGWTDPESAILGAAKCLSSWYINPTVSSAKVSGDQNTLWKMKWDARAAEKTGSVSHEYATGITWATGIASIMSEFYESQGYSFEQTGLSFIVPRFE